MTKLSGPGSTFLNKIRCELIEESGEDISKDDLARGVRERYSLFKTQAGLAKHYGVSRAIVNAAINRFVKDNISTADRAAISLGYRSFRDFMLDHDGSSIRKIAFTLGISRSTVRQAIGR